MVKVLDQVTSTLQRLGPALNYGTPVKVGDSEVVPVSLVWMGFGGGEGPDGSGGGGGGGGVSVPVGAYVDGIDGPEFQPNVVTLLVASGIFVGSVGSAIAGIVNAARGKRGLLG